ncbi:hypothetical protein HC761_00730 [bacterium]|nr:hypothetical protein [bacterium]
MLLACNVEPIRLLMHCRFNHQDAPGKRIFTGLDTQWLRLALEACEIRWTEVISAQVRIAESAMLKWLNR